jgi:hypothetical protein
MSTQDFRIPNRATGIGIANTNINFTDIQIEFGGANPIGLTEYYSGGPYVPTGVSGFRGNVPSSGSISALDLAKVDLVGIFTKKWSSSSSLDTPVGSINNDGLFFFSSTNYDTSLQTWVMPTAVFERDGTELWAFKIGAITTTKPTHTTSFSTSTGNFAVGGFDEPANASDRSRAYILEYDKSLLTVKHRSVTSSNFNLIDAHWAKDKNNDDVYMVARNRNIASDLILMKFNGPISSISDSSSINWAIRFGVPPDSPQAGFTSLKYMKISSFMHDGARNRLYIAVVANDYPNATGVLNKGAFLLLGFNATNGALVKYGWEYQNGTYPTDDYSADYYECVLTDSDSGGGVYGLALKRNTANGVSNKYHNNRIWNVRFEMDGTGEFTLPTQNPDPFEISSGWPSSSPKGYAQSSVVWYNPDPDTWNSEIRPIASFVIDEDSPIVFPTTRNRNPSDTGTVINFSTQLLEPENTTLSLTGGRIIVATTSTTNTNTEEGSGRATWYIRDNTYTETNMFLDLYNYSSVFQQKTNKKRIGLAATSRSKTSTKNDLMLTIMPVFSEINYYLTNVWYQKVGDPPRSPDPQPRYGDQIYGNVTYKTISKYMYDNGLILYNPYYIMRDYHNIYDVKSDFTVSTPSNWLGWATSQGNPITKTSSYPNTTYATAPSSSTTEYYTITTNQQELNLRNWLLAQGWNGVNPVYVTVNSGVYIWSDNTSVPALTIDGNFPNGLVIENYGYIMGRGGNAGNAGNAVPSLQNVAGQNGGPAILTSVELNINSSNGYIGGGGGGGASYINDVNGYTVGGGGGQGGGIGGVGYFSGNFAQGGAGGSIGNSGANGTAVSGPDFNIFGGGGGGRVFPGVGAPAVTNQQGGGIGGTGGGSGACSLAFNVTPKSSGAGGSAGVAGGSPLVYKNVYPHGGAGGGGFGAAGGGISFNNSETPASSGGPSIQTINGVTVTWIGGFPTNRVFGAVV